MASSTVGCVPLSPRTWKPTRVVASQLFQDYMVQAAKLAAWFCRQPSGGSAAQGFVHENRLRADGCAQVEATHDELVSDWYDWCPIGNSVPKSVLGTLPFAEPFEKRDFPASSTGAGQGARRS
eukprot:7749735-Pyramimonas_sp.AAC.1